MEKAAELHWTNGTYVANLIIGLALIGSYWVFGTVWPAYIGTAVLVYAQLERAWHKTIRPAIIELIREALR